MNLNKKKKTVARQTYGKCTINGFYRNFHQQYNINVDNLVRIKTNAYLISQKCRK